MKVKKILRAQVKLQNALTKKTRWVGLDLITTPGELQAIYNKVFSTDNAEHMYIVDIFDPIGIDVNTPEFWHRKLLYQHGPEIAGIIPTDADDENLLLLGGILNAPREQVLTYYAEVYDVICELLRDDSYPEGERVKNLMETLLTD